MAQPVLPGDPLSVYRALLESDARVELIDGEVVVHAAYSRVAGALAPTVGACYGDEVAHFQPEHAR